MRRKTAPKDTKSAYVEIQPPESEKATSSPSGFIESETSGTSSHLQAPACLGPSCSLSRPEVVCTGSSRSFVSQNGYSREPIVFKLQRMTLYSLKAIDDINQQFQAHVYFEFVIPDGQKNPELTAGAGDEATPPFRSAQWYWQLQLEISNACRYDTRERKIRLSKLNADIICCLRVDGVFFANFDFRDFPLDKQEVRFHLEFLCSKFGPSPIEISLPDDSSTGTFLGIDQQESGLEKSVPISATPNSETSTVTKSWDIDPEARYKTVETVFEDGDVHKVFPGVVCSIRIVRLNNHFILSLLTPMACLSAISIITFFFTNLILRVTMSVSLISASVPQFVRVQMFLPKVQYVTKLHSFMLANVLLMLLVVFINTSITAVSDTADVFGGSGTDRSISLLPQIVCPVLWLIIHAYSARSIFYLRRSRQSWVSGKRA